MPEYVLENRDSLLHDIAEALRDSRLEKTATVNLRVCFFEDDELLVEFLGLQGAIEAIAHDVYWNEESNWASANRAEVDTY